jgi:hypothetical protein
MLGSEQQEEQAHRQQEHRHHEQRRTDRHGQLTEGRLQRQEVTETDKFPYQTRKTLLIDSWTEFCISHLIAHDIVLLRCGLGTIVAATQYFVMLLDI